MVKTLQSFKITKFVKEESWGGILLILATIAAMIWANSSAYASYHYFWHEVYLSISIGSFSLSGNLHNFINDGLMALFFFTIGLEIKREIIGGELTSLKKASLPIVAAIGGMVVPALLFIAINGGNADFRNGWGIPMATDIAFALGILSLLGEKVPLNLKVFLTALAIADDLGAIIVIAIFYTENINVNELLNAAIGIAVLGIANFYGARRTTFYAIIGFSIVWIAFIFSGVHATIAGVLVAFTIPARPKISEESFLERLSVKFEKFRSYIPNDNSLLTDNQSHIVDSIEKLSNDAHTPLQKLEHALHPFVAYLILPLFALANAGVHIEGDILALLFHPVSLGIIAGLVLGKMLGIKIFTYFMVKTKLAQLPDGVTSRHILGASLLAGVGFTMSIFVSDLAFADPVMVQIAKVGIFAASLISAVAGYVVLSKAK